MYKLSLERRGRYNAGLGYAFSSADSSLLLGLTHYWTLNEQSGTRNDSVGTAHLTDNNTVGYLAGKNGNAATFLAGSSEYLSLASFDMAPPYTIAGWVKLSGGSASPILEYHDSGGWPNGIPCIIYRATPDSLSLLVGNGTSYSVGRGGQASGGTLLDSAWHHFVGWIDTDNKPYMSVDNFTANSKENYQAITSAPLTGAHRFKLSRSETSTIDNYSSNSLDELGIWSRILTAQERTVLYNAGSGKFYPEF